MISWWPALAALGLMLLVWGAIASWIVGVVGLLILTSASAGWIEEIRR